MTNSNKNKTVIVAMSGGVDSSVAAALLVEQGYNVIGVTMKMFNFDDVGGNVHRESGCCGLDAFNDARIVAVKLGIPHYIMDLSEQFGKDVIDNFVDEYKNGRTPNPCIICNTKIKWGELLKKADTLGAKYIATGHYARIVFDELTKRYNILRARDIDKDQTYALWGLNQDALSRTIFPLGDLTKSVVRQIAAKNNLKTAAKEESFEICFVADNDYRRFLRERFEKMNENIADGDIVLDGKVVGKHEGIPFYTIGQRSGIGAYGEKVYVKEIDPKRNVVTLGRNKDLLHQSLIVKDINLISVASIAGSVRAQAMVRYKDTPTAAVISPRSDDTLHVIFNEPKRAITPGQSFVMYDGERLVGGGVIEKVIN
ncbi:MAG: tRNA 2-thiouridine(34) synthase MnmA [Bacteroidota bacterium]|nr:tRNA 2-thiouridine(34) synthase MnmA [Bacteroidota bacterium]